MNKSFKFLAAAALSMAALLTACTPQTTPNGENEYAEPVDLEMSIAAKTIVMGEELSICFDVKDQSSQVTNEELTIRLKATEGTEDASVLFKDFPSKVKFAKGESKLVVSVPIADKVTGSHNVTINAESRGYNIAGSNQLITVADYHYVTASIEGNAENVVEEGAKFVLLASLEVPAKEDVKVAITPAASEEGYYQNLASEILVKKGETTGKSAEVTMAADGGIYNNVELTLNFASSSASHPVKNASVKIQRKDVDKPLGTELQDERHLYSNPDLMYVSADYEADIKAWKADAQYVIMKKGDPHPNSGNTLPAGKWKFYNAYEFHHIAKVAKEATSNDGKFKNAWYPACFADQNTAAVETAGAVDNARYTWITEEGYLRMITLKEQVTSKRDKKSYNFGTSALFANKFNANNTNNHGFKPSNTRIYPGMRVEVRARMRGAMTGMLPGIWFQGNEAQGGEPQYVNWPTYGEIDAMEINTRSNPWAVEQTYHCGPLRDGGVNYNPTTGRINGLTQLDEYHIYWMEWVDNETVEMGVNAQMNKRITKAEVEKAGYTWPFTTAVNDEGLHILFTMMFLHKIAPNDDECKDYKGITYETARLPEHNVKTSPIPRMEIDWVRFYTNDTYQIPAGKKFNNYKFY